MKNYRLRLCGWKCYMGVLVIIIAMIPVVESAVIWEKETTPTAMSSVSKNQAAIVEDIFQEKANLLDMSMIEASAKYPTNIDNKLRIIDKPSSKPSTMSSEKMFGYNASNDPHQSYNGHEEEEIDVNSSLSETIPGVSSSHYPHSFHGHEENLIVHRSSSDKANLYIGTNTNVSLIETPSKDQDPSPDTELIKNNLIYNAVVLGVTKATLPALTATLTCRDLETFQRSFPGMKTEGILSSLGMNDQPYDPKNELKHTARCQAKNQESLKQPWLSLLCNIIIGSFFFYKLPRGLVRYFSPVQSDSTEANNETRCGMSGYCLISFGESLIILLIIMTIISVAVINFEFIKFIEERLCLLLCFIVSLVIFHFHGCRTNLLRSVNQNLKTLLISARNPDDCNESILLNRFPSSTEVKMLKRFDKLEELYKDLQNTIAVQKVLRKKLAKGKPVRQNLFKKPFDTTEFYKEKEKEIRKQIDEELKKIDKQSGTYAYVTFPTREIAEETYQNISHPYQAKWAPPVEDIVWAANHKQGKWHLFKMIVVNIAKVLFTLLLSSMLLALIRLVNTDDTGGWYLRPLFNIISLFLVISLDQINHARKSTTHLGLFFSTLVILVVSEVFLPMFSFKNIYDFFQWMAADVDHDLRLLCIFRPDLGAEMALTILGMTLIFNRFIIDRIAKYVCYFYYLVTSATALEAKIKLKRRDKHYEIGICYAEMIAQFLMTLIGCVTYPPIIRISLVCMIIRVLIDKHMCNVFPNTVTGINIHRWAIFCATFCFVITCGLVLIKPLLVLGEYVDTEETYFCIKVFIAGNVFVFFVVTIAVLTWHFSQSQMANGSEQSEDCKSYDPPFYTKLKRMQDVAPDEESNFDDNEEQTQQEEGVINKRIDTSISFTLQKKLKYLAIFGGYCVCVLVFPFWLFFMLFHVPEIAYSNLANDSLIVESPYKHALYTGRVPYETMVDVCSRKNQDTLNFNWLTLESRCEDILLDQSIRDHQDMVFKNLQPSQRMIWTGGLFNLTESEKWKWLNPKATTKYENFCNNTNLSFQIAKAKVNNDTLLYIIKDYTNGNLKRSGLGCWQVYSRRDLDDIGFNVGSVLINSPRLPFVCKIDTQDNGKVESKISINIINSIAINLSKA